MQFDPVSSCPDLSYCSLLVKWASRAVEGGIVWEYVQYHKTRSMYCLLYMYCRYEATNRFHLETIFRFDIL